MAILGRKRFYRVATVVVPVLTLLLAVVGVHAAELGVWEAAERALKHDVAAHIAALTFENSRITYEKSIANNLLTGSDYSRRTAEAALRSAEISYANKRADIVAKTVRDYFGLLTSELTVEIRNRQLEVARMTLDATVRKSEMGTASRLDLLDAQVNVDRAVLDARAAEKQLELARSNFAAAVGMAVDELPALNLNPARPQMAATLEEAIAKALERSASLVSAYSNLEFARLDYEQAVAEGVAPLDLRAAQIKVQLAELELGQAEQSVRQSVESAYEAVLRSANDLELQEVQYSAAVERHELIRQQFEAGLKTQTELINQQISLAQAKQARLNALRDHFEAVLAYNRLFGEPLGDTTDVR